MYALSGRQCSSFGQLLVSRSSSGAPQPAEASSALLRNVWATINPAHAVQKASAIVAFNEEITSFTVKKVVDAVREEARKAGLVKEEPVNTVVFQITPGTGAHAASNDNVGTTFQDVQGAIVVSSLTITNTAIRFETSSYSRWIAFREQFYIFVNKCLPILSQTVPVKQIAVEYVDFFYARAPGSPDAGLVIDRKSPSISSKAFNRREPFHSHSGWFEGSGTPSKKLINIDVTVSDANGPDGLRRTITVRTFEAEQIDDPFSIRSAELANPENILSGLDVLHLALKGKLADVLTRDARAMISLGN